MRAIPREVNDASVKNVADAYALGLWCADGYWWSSSIGLSNVEPELIIRFGGYLANVLQPDRLRLRIYEVKGTKPNDRVMALTTRTTFCPGSKMKQVAYHIYVNSRPLLRAFLERKERVADLEGALLAPYLAGRFDGDGCFGVTPRLAYTRSEEAHLDAELLARAGVPRTSVLYYRKANEYCVYIHRSDQKRFKMLIQPFSWKINRRFTL